MIGARVREQDSVSPDFDVMARDSMARIRLNLVGASDDAWPPATDETKPRAIASDAVVRLGRGEMSAPSVLLGAGPWLPRTTPGWAAPLPQLIAEVMSALGDRPALIDDALVNRILSTFDEPNRTEWQLERPLEIWRFLREHQGARVRVVISPAETGAGDVADDEGKTEDVAEPTGSLRPTPVLVGREAERDRFFRELAPSGRVITSISGIGGIGKTTLLTQLLDVGAPAVVVDARDQVTAPADVGILISQRLAAALAPTSQTGRLIRNAGRPGAGNVEPIRRAQHDPRSSLSDATTRSSDATTRASDATTRAILEDVNAFGRPGRPVILAFDTYEVQGQVVGPWLLDALLNAPILPRAGHLRIIVSGREPLQRTDPRWARVWHDAILTIRLAPFTLEETGTYLERSLAGVVSPADVARAQRVSGGLPFWLELLRQGWSDRPTPEASPEDVRAIVDCFLAQWDDPRHRRWVRTAWVPRWFTIEVLRALLGDEAEDAFNWLSRQPSVVESRDGRWVVHQTVRSALRWEALQRAPRDFLAWNERLAAYWWERVGDEPAALGEAVYHALVSRAPERADADVATAYVRIYVASEGRDAAGLGAIVDGLRAARHDTTDLRTRPVLDAIEAQWRGTQAGDQVLIAAARDRLLAAHVLRPRERAGLLYARLVERGVTLDAPARPPEPMRAAWLPRFWRRLFAGDESVPVDRERAEALGEYGDTLRLAGEYDEAIAVLDAAVLCDPRNGAARASRGDALRMLGRPAEAAEDLSMAISLGERDTWVYAARGCAQLFADRLEAALADAQAVLDVEPTNALALAVRGVVRARSDEGLIPEALVDLRAALAADPSLGWAEAMLADLLAAHGRPNDGRPEGGSPAGTDAELKADARLGPDSGLAQAAGLATDAELGADAERGADDRTMQGDPRRAGPRRA